MNAETGLSCPSCGAPQHAGDRFCEQCGARLDEEQEERVGCRACGAPADAIGEDGYCSVCGVRERPGDTRIELDLVFAAAVSDQGRVHRRNEDSFHLEASGDRNVAIVVCDGISSATRSSSAICDSAPSGPTESSPAGRRAVPRASSWSIAPTKFDQGRGHEHRDRSFLPVMRHAVSGRRPVLRAMRRSAR